jgi:hypothetical protein
MNYELCKKLKDAGFPFIEHHPNMGMDNYLCFVDENGWKYPTLSELIEACGTCQLSVFADAKFSQAMSDKQIGEGATPEEAVAKLYLALNT